MYGGCASASDDRKSVLAGRREHEAHVARHEAVEEDSRSSSGGGDPDQGKVVFPVVTGEEHCLAKPPLRDMVRISGHDHTRHPMHGGCPPGASRFKWRLACQRTDIVAELR